MSRKLHYLLGIVLFLLLLPARGMSQTTDNTAAQTATAPHKNVVKKAWNGTKRDVSIGAKATAHATTKAWHGTKGAVSTGAKATGHATTKAWHGTERAANTAVRAPGKAIHKAKVKHEIHEEQKAADKQ